MTDVKLVKEYTEFGWCLVITTQKSKFPGTCTE